MYNVILVCQHGASTDLLSEKMDEAAKEQGIDMIVNAYPYNKLDQYIDEADIVLLAPQVRFKKNFFEEQYSDKDIQFLVIDTVDYGMLNGKSVVKKTLEALKVKK